MQFTLQSNEGIRNFFNGDNSYIPKAELIYLHTHPLIRPNFLNEIHSLVEEVAIIISTNNIKGQVIEKIQNIAISIGQALPSVNDSNAESILLELRELYKVCTGLKEVYK